MNLLRLDPFRELETINDRLHQAFNKVLHNPELATTWSPAVDITETKKEFLIKMELPEVKKEDVKISLENGTLYIQGERKKLEETKGEKLHCVERCYGIFVRTFNMPDNIEASKIDAEFKDGVLNIHLPKSLKYKSHATKIKVH